MAAVVLKVSQTGSASAALHVQPGDVLTFELAETVHSGEIANAVAGLTVLQTIHGVQCLVNPDGLAS